MIHPLYVFRRDPPGPGFYCQVCGAQQNVVTTTCRAEDRRIHRLSTETVNSLSD